MAEEIRAKTWARVPDKSHLVVSVEGTKKDRMLVAIFREVSGKPIQNSPPTGLVFDTVNGTPLRIPLKSPNRYSFEIILTFMEKLGAEVHAHIEDKNGQQFEDALDTVISRDAGQIEVVMLTVGMKKKKP